MDRRTATATLLAWLTTPISVVQAESLSPVDAQPSAVPLIHRPPTTPALGFRKGGVAWPGRGPLLATVQTVGGPLPGWAEPGSPGTAADDEIVLVRADAPLSCQATVEANHRFVVMDERLDDPPHLQCAFVVRAAGSDLDATAEVLACSLVGDILIGLDLGALLDLASSRTSGAGLHAPDRQRRLNKQGHALVLDGLGSGLSLVPAAREAWDALGRRGFERGVFVTALVGEEDTDPFTLANFVDFLTGLIAHEPHRPLLATALLNASRNAVVVVGC